MYHHEAVAARAKAYQAQKAQSGPLRVDTADVVNWAAGTVFIFTVGAFLTGLATTAVAVVGHWLMTN